MDKQDIKEIVECRCIDEMSFSTHWGGQAYAFNSEKWTACPWIVWSRHRKRLVLKDKPEIKKQSSKKAKRKGE